MEYADTATGYADTHQIGVRHFDREPHSKSLKGSSPIKPSIYPCGVEALKIGMRNHVLCLAIKGSPIGITCHQNELHRKFAGGGVRGPQNQNEAKSRYACCFSKTELAEK